MTAHARASDPAPSKRAAERINSVDPNKPSDELKAAVMVCMRSAQTKVGSFCRRDIESLMAFSDAGKRGESDERWSSESVRRCYVWLVRQGDLLLIDDSGAHERHRLKPEPVEAEPAKTQRSFFEE